jgi:hypothetical protein
MKNYNPNYLTKNKLWDSDWLKIKYPDRFDNYYYGEDLQEDQYDHALYNKGESFTEFVNID